jgi:NTE family protein
MAKRALVLGGGGSVGIGWMTGLTAGFREAGIDLGSADLIVGTSAGSVIGTHLAAGFDPRLVLQMQRQMAGNVPAQAAPQVDPELVSQVFARWASAGEVTPEVRRELGAMAVTARTMPEESYIAMFATLLGVTEWPERRLLLAAVDAGTGDFQVWDRAGAAPIVQAVASSCCVPGIFPPVTIDGARYVDGGVRSGTNADLAAGHERVLIVAPLGETQFESGRRQLAAEIAGLKAGGAAVELIQPDQAALAAFGPSMMDATRTLPAAEAGLRQAGLLTARLREFWH